MPAGPLFPGELPPRQRCRFVAPDGRNAGITKAAHKGQGWFCLTLRWDAADIAADEAKRADRNARKEMADTEAKAMAEAKEAADALAERPATHAAFREQAANFLWRLMGVFRVAYVNGVDPSGFRFTADTREEFDDLTNLLCWHIKNGGTTLDAEVRTRKLTEARAKAGKANYPLQQFLKRTAEAPTVGDA